MARIPLVLLASLFWLTGCGDSPPPDSADTPNVPTSDPKILNDSQALDKKYGIAAGLHCSADADDYLRSISKYSFKWDDLGTFDFKFDRFLQTVSSPGVITETSNKVALQNGLGAYERIGLLCNYDTQDKKVLGFSIR